MTPDLSHQYGHVATAILGRPSLTTSCAAAVPLAPATFPNATFQLELLPLGPFWDGMTPGMQLTTCWHNLSLLEAVVAEASSVIQPTPICIDDTEVASDP